MRLPKKTGRFFLLAAAIYAILMAPGTGLDRGYAYLFRSAGNVFFARFWIWGDAGVRFMDLRNLAPGDLAPGTPAIQATGEKDTLMELRRRGAASIGYLRTSSRYMGYSPTALLIALIVATPMTWRRRGWSLLAGLALTHVFIAVRLTLTLCAGGFAAQKDYALFAPSALWQNVLTQTESVVSDDPMFSFVAPTFIWFVVALAWQRSPDKDKRTKHVAHDEKETN